MRLHHLNHQVPYLTLMKTSFFEHVKIILYSITIAAILIAVLVLAAMAIPVLIGIFVVLIVYVIIRLLNEDVDVD